MLSTIPIFPLPSTVLFPNVFLPLHIFEPRYRQMVGDALTGERLIGMVLLKPGYEADYDGRPAVYPIGTAGLITHAERLEDGRFNIVLQGVDKFVITGEEAPSHGRLYRVAHVATRHERLDECERAPLREERHRLEARLTAVHSALERRIPRDIGDEDLINALAQYLDFQPIEKLALLERDGALERCRSLVELLEIRALERTGDDHTTH